MSSITSSPARGTRASGKQGPRRAAIADSKALSSASSASSQLSASIVAGVNSLSDFLSRSASGGRGANSSASSQSAATGLMSAASTPSRIQVHGVSSRACITIQPGTPASRPPASLAPYLAESPSGSMSAVCSPAVGSRFLAENGQPRKGMCIPANKSKTQRGLDFGGAGAMDTDNWSISSVSAVSDTSTS